MEDGDKEKAGDTLLTYLLTCLLIRGNIMYNIMLFAILKCEALPMRLRLGVLLWP